MTTQKDTKLRILFKMLEAGNVVTASQLEKIGISRSLQKYYLESGWLHSLGRGVYQKPDSTIEWQGALYAIEKQTTIQVHVGGLSALSFQGFSHYFRFNKEILYLFSPQKTNLPKWFTSHNWKLNLYHKSSSFLPEVIGIKKNQIKQHTISASTPERAIIECLYLAPKMLDLVECYQLFEGLVNLKPKLVTELLVNCNSIKVKRLFLYMAEKANHKWFQFLKTDDINLGHGKRMIVHKGSYDAKYLISIPKELIEL